jgi:YegS/Rv2252/BmrU family lipid kinase
MRHGLLVYNPTAGQRDVRGRMSALIDRMREKGVELVNAPTSGPGDATQIVKTFLPRGLDVVVVCGGDGTISEAVCGLVGSDVPLAVIPAGTSNVLAVELGIPLDLAGAEKLLVEGKPRRVRLGMADGRPFLLWAGVGIDARVMGQMNLALKRHLGRAGIFGTALTEFLQYEFPRLEVEVDGVRHSATFAVVCRAKHYAGRWIIAPEARLEADHFDVLLFDHRDRARLFLLFREMQRRRSGHLANGLARIIRGREVSIRALEPYPVDIQVDGDCVLKTPVDCRIGTESVLILAPARGKS